MANNAELQEKLQVVLDRWRSEMERLQAEVQGLEGDERAKCEQRIADLEARDARIQTKLEQLNEQGEGFWEQFKAEVEEIFLSMGEGLEMANAINETEAVSKNPPKPDE